MVVPSPPFPPGPRPEMAPLSKEALRRAALDARKAFVRTLSDADRALLEQRAVGIGQSGDERLARIERGAAQRLLAQRLHFRPGAAKEGR